MKKRAAALKLIDLAAQTEPVEIVVATPPNEAESQNRLDEFDLEQRFVIPARELVEELARALAREGWRPDNETSGRYEDGRWTFGAMMTFKGRRRSIHYGFIDPVRVIPILDRVPDLVAFYLITMEGGEDYLKRERHSHLGWHYHYLDRSERRSNVILCWDTRWEAPLEPTTPPALRGLFVERHAEGGKPFKARPSAWTKTKRQSMYSACDADLRSRDIKEYRCAANKSEPVYPPDAELTARRAIFDARERKGGNAKALKP